MKMYHTETQEDYDALMVELERLGIQTLGKRYWEVYENQTVVIVHAFCRHSKSTRTDTAYGSLGWALQNYPTVPIQKYKAKADEKMKFTKENVYKLAERYSVDQGYLIGDLKSDISKLDDKPEKVVVPKFVAEWIQSYLNEGGTPIDVLGSLMSFHASFVDESVIRWFKKNSKTMLKALTNGYTIEPEQLYYIPLPSLETSDGIQQVLSKRKNDTNYFASRPASALQQRFTKEELEQVPEVFKPYATLIEEEEELFMLLTEYAKTPLEAREEPKKYKLKHKLIRGNDGYLNYAGSKKELIFSSETEIRDIRATATIQEWESLTEQTWEDLLLQFKAIEV